MRYPRGLVRLLALLTLLALLVHKYLMRYPRGLVRLLQPLPAAAAAAAAAAWAYVDPPKRGEAQRRY